MQIISGKLTSLSAWTINNKSLSIKATPPKPRSYSVLRFLRELLDRSSDLNGKKFKKKKKKIIKNNRLNLRIALIGIQYTWVMPIPMWIRCRRFLPAKLIRLSDCAKRWTKPNKNFAKMKKLTVFPKFYQKCVGSPVRFVMPGERIFERFSIFVPPFVVVERQN